MCRMERTIPSAPDEDAEPFKAQVTVSKEELSEACDSTGYMMGNYIYLKTHFQNFVDHGTGSFDVAGGKVAWLNYSARFDEWNVTEKDFYIVVGQTAYLVNCKIPSDQYEAWRGVFDAIGESIAVDP